jgi:hypothetical protein
MIKTLLVQPEELCNPFNGERVHSPLQHGQRFMPMDEIIIQSGLPDLGKAPQQYLRVRVLLANLEPVPGSPRPKGDWFTRMSELVQAMLSGRKPEARRPQLVALQWSLLCEPIEEFPPGLRRDWRVGRHGQWCSVTIKDNPKIYAVRTNNLFPSESLDLFTEEYYEQNLE